jgi:hypothetical protein
LDVFLKYLNAQNLNAFIYVSDLQEEATMDKKSKWKQVQEDLQLIYMTSCREVKEREIVKEEIRRVKIGREAPRKAQTWGASPERELPFFPGCQWGREEQRHEDRGCIRKEDTLCH